MPLYDYKCEKCGQVFEVRQNFSDAKLTTHEGCGGPLERLISAPALQFKGSGWYITDYAKGGGANTKSGGAAAKTETKSDSTPTSSTSSSSDKKS